MDDATQGTKFEYREIPAEMKEQCAEWRAKMVEAAAEGSEELLHKYLEHSDLSDADIRLGLRLRSIRNEIVITMCGSAFKNKGVQAMLDAIIEFMPSPTEMPPVKGTLPDGSEGFRKASDDEKVLGSGIQDPERSVRRQPDVLPCLLGRAQFG